MPELEAEIFYEPMPNRNIQCYLEIDSSTLCVTLLVHKSVVFSLLLYTIPAIHVWHNFGFHDIRNLARTVC